MGADGEDLRHGKMPRRSHHGQHRAATEEEPAPAVPTVPRRYRRGGTRHRPARRILWRSRLDDGRRLRLGLDELPDDIAHRPDVSLDGGGLFIKKTKDLIRELQVGL